MRQAILALALTAVTVLAGCASGPEFSKAQEGLTPLAPTKGRIFIYRSTSLGAAIQPDVRVNGEVVGTSKGNGIFYVDRDPGNIEVVIGTEVEKHLTFTLAAGNVRYVKCDVNMGLFVAHIVPILVDEKDAKKEISDLAFTGGK
jgi:hypothetical protein